ncbi:hypothetical protein ES705_38552 [subsurface metagenome]
MKKEKKPLYKRVWFWLLMIFVALPMTIGVITGKTEEAVEKVEEAVNYAEEEAASYAKEKAEAEKPRVLTEEEKVTVAAQVRKATIEAQFSFRDGSHRGLTAYIKKNMNDPKSYKHAETWYRDDGDFVTVQTKFRGTNAFGGVVINTVWAKCSLGGQVLEIISQE